MQTALNPSMKRSFVEDQWYYTNGMASQTTLLLWVVVDPKETKGMVAGVSAVI